MMKIVASLVILGLCANVCFAVPTSFTSQSGAISSSLLNSSAIKVMVATNSTDATNWNGAYLTTPTTTIVPETGVFFGPGAKNDTSYVYGITVDTSNDELGKIVKRTLNNTIVAWGNDTVMASVVATDITISSTTPVTSSTIRTAVAPGYLAVLSHGSDGTNDQVYVNIVTGSSATQYIATTTADTTTACASGVTTPVTATTVTSIGNIWYDINATAFFFTWSTEVDSTPCNSGTAGTLVTTYSVGLGGIYPNGTFYWTKPGLSIAGSTSTNPITAGSVLGGSDNWLNSTNLWVVYKDTTAEKIYAAKATKATTTTAIGSWQLLTTDDGTSNAAKTYTPLSVWCSNATYGIAVAVENQTAASVYNYPIQNYLNGTTTATDSGLSYTSVTDSTGGAFAYYGWPLTTGYTAVAGWITATTDAYNYQFGTFYGNGTVNTTATSLATSLQGNIGFYQDVNGAQWVGWSDVDSDDGTYALYLARLQGQLNVVSGANVLSAISAFFALFLAAIFVF